VTSARGSTRGHDDLGHRAALYEHGLGGSGARQGTNHLGSEAERWTSEAIGTECELQTARDHKYYIYAH